MITNCYLYDHKNRNEKNSKLVQEKIKKPEAIIIYLMPIEKVLFHQHGEI
jgi:hypothetical protein